MTYLNPIFSGWGSLKIYMRDWNDMLSKGEWGKMFHRAVCTLAGTLEQLCLSLAERNPCCKQKQKHASVASNVLYDSSGLDRKNVKKNICLWQISKHSVLAQKTCKIRWLDGNTKILPKFQNCKTSLISIICNLT